MTKRTGNPPGRPRLAVPRERLAITIDSDLKTWLELEASKLKVTVGEMVSYIIDRAKAGKISP
jgi:hypothetical protein